MEPGNPYQILATIAYTKIKYIIEQTVASGLIYLNSHVKDFANPDIRPYIAICAARTASQLSIASS